MKIGIGTVAYFEARLWHINCDDACEHWRICQAAPLSAQTRPHYARKTYNSSHETVSRELLPSVGLYSSGFWRFFGFFSKMNMKRSKVHRTGWCRENQALCVGQVSIELI